MSGLGDRRDGFTEALKATGVAAIEAEQSHPLERLPLDAESHRLPGLAGEILLRRSGRQEAPELAVQLLQDGVLELGVRGLGLQIVLGDSNSQYVSVPVGKFNVLSGKSNLQERKNKRWPQVLNSLEANR